MSSARSGLELAVEAVCAAVALMVAYRTLPPAKRPGFLRILKWMFFAFAAFAALILVLALIREYIGSDR